jgi:cytochrome c nitrite reductase small subunit
MLPRLLLSAIVGLTLGLGGFTFWYARGSAYLTNDPAACANCHVMQEQYAGWVKSSHRAVATCNDCHTPHALVPKYWTKLSNGLKHSWYFTAGGFPEPIQIAPHSQQIAEAACRTCHQEITAALSPAVPHGEDLSCLRCHPSVGHLH